MQPYDVIGFGALNVDRIGMVSRVVRDGEGIVEQEIRSPGGSAANTIWMLAQLGRKTGFIGAVGNDEEGTLLLDSFKIGRVDTRFVVRKSESSGAVLGLTDPKNHRVLYVFPGANSHLNDKDLPKRIAAAYLHISSFVDTKQLKVQIAFVKANPACKLSFAPGMLYAQRGLTALKPLLVKTKVLILNRAELKQLTQTKRTKGTSILLKLGIPMMVVSLGKRGSLLITPTERQLVPACSVKAVDTTGAGDALAAGVLYGLVKKWEPNRAVCMGNLVASYCVQQLGSRVALPSIQTLYKQL